MANSAKNVIIDSNNLNYYCTDSNPFPRDITVS
jgi:hypothetical protein